MDPSEKNQYRSFYTRNQPFFSVRFFGLFSILLLFAAIPVIILTVGRQTNSNSHASGPEPSISPTIMLADQTGTISATPMNTPTATITSAITTTPTMMMGTPTATLTPTATPGSYLSVSIILPAIGIKTGNVFPLHPTRSLILLLYNTATQQSYSAIDAVTFDNISTFKNNHFSLGNIPAGNYEIIATMPGNLQKFLIQTNGTNTFAIQPNTTTVIPPAVLIPGDIAPIPGLNNQPYGDNVLDITDYNQMIGCYSDLAPAKACSDVGRLASDLNDDGKVNAVDYNILLRSFATRNGDTLQTMKPALLSFHAVLNGMSETPPNTSTASGQSTITFSPQTKQALITLSFHGLSSTESAAHTHGPAVPGVAAAHIDVLPLGQSISYTTTFSADEIQYLQNGLLYVNVHSAKFPDGEIRGQYVSDITNPSPTPIPTMTTAPTVQTPTPTIH